MIYKVILLFAGILTFSTSFAKDPYYKRLSEMPEKMQSEVMKWGVEKPFQIVVDSCGWNGTIEYVHDSDILSYNYHEASDTTYYSMANKIVISLVNSKFNRTYKTEITREKVKLMEGEKYEQFDVRPPRIKELTDEHIVINTAIVMIDTDVGDNLYITINKNGISTKNESIW